MHKTMPFTKEDLINFKPQHASFVGIDSDGCVFDTMEIKQKQSFHKLIIAHWRLQSIEKQLRESAEFVNLYSKYRGRNRFPCLVQTIDLLRNRPEVIAAGVSLPEFKALRKFIDSGLPLSNLSLENQVKQTGDPELARVLAWSQAVNKDIEKTVTNVPPYAWVLESLRLIHKHSDAICISQTPTEALVREWQQHKLIGYVEIIAGQELGTKTEHLRLATSGRYRPENILMIGDAPGDLSAAKSNQANFYPINPGQEVESWERFYKEAYHKFLRHEYSGAYEDGLIAGFEKLLPETPPWQIAQS